MNTIDTKDIFPSSSVQGEISELERQEIIKLSGAKRWSGIFALGVALLLASIIIIARMLGQAQHESSVDHAWNLIFTIVGSATAYIFQNGSSK
ncbi:MAG: hypothetical protein ACOYO0_01570 [Sandarakinorhabdus sp.]